MGSRTTTFNLIVSYLFLGIGILSDLSIFSVKADHSDTPKRIVCFYNAQDRGYIHPFNYEPKDIPGSMCTDVVYAKAYMDEETYEVENRQYDKGRDLMREFTSLGMGRYSGTNFLVSVGAANSKLWSMMADDASKRLAFVTSALSLIKDYGFNGLDLNWGTPYPSDRGNYVKLVEELVEAFKPSKLLLTCSPALQNIVEDHVNKTMSGFNVQRLSELFDYINVDAQTLRAPWKNLFVDVPSPLHRRPFDANRYEKLNLHDGLEIMTHLGAPRHKLMMGIPFNGLTYTLRSSSDTHLYALVDTSVYGGDPGPVTHSRGLLYYYEICRLLTTEDWTKRFDHVGKCPYAFKGNQWVGYEDYQSIHIKAEYIKNQGYGGVNVWSLNMDDFNGLCGSENPLLHALAHALGKKIIMEPEHYSNGTDLMLLKRYMAMGISSCDDPSLISNHHSNH